MNNMKILITVGSFTNGGAERVASLWANGFISRGHDVTVVVNKKQTTKNTYPVDHKVQVKNIYSWTGMKLSWFLHVHLIMEWKLRREICQVKPDVIICVLPPWAKWSRMAIGGMNIPIINTEHNSFERPESAPMTKQQLCEKYVDNKYYDIVTVLTEADKRLTDGILKNVYVLPNPLAFKPACFVPKKEKIILAMGRLDAGHCKGFDVLIKAFGMTCNDWSLQIAGAGAPETIEKYRLLTRECGVEDRVQFIGFVDNPIPLYQRASIFVLSSRYEGFGMVLIEAMSQGCAPVACDYKGRQKEIITNESEGLLCEPDNPKALAEAINRMVTDEKYRSSVQKNAIERSKYYSLENIMDRWEKILKKIDNNETK